MDDDEEGDDVDDGDGGDDDDADEDDDDDDNDDVDDDDEANDDDDDDVDNTVAIPSSSVAGRRTGLHSIHSRAVFEVTRHRLSRVSMGKRCASRLTGNARKRRTTAAVPQAGAADY